MVSFADVRFVFIATSTEGQEGVSGGYKHYDKSGQGMEQTLDESGRKETCAFVSAH